MTPVALYLDTLLPVVTPEALEPLERCQGTTKPEVT